MNSESGFNGRAVAFSAFAGAIVGATAVLLLAPRVRQESAERIRGLSHDLKERASAAIDTARETISSSVSRGRDALDEKRSVVSSVVGAGKEAYARRKTDVPTGG